MAQRNWTRDEGSLAKARRIIDAIVDVGASGAVTLKQWNFQVLGGPSGATYTAAPTTGAQPYAQGTEGIRSVARTAAGLWTVTFQDTYQRLLAFDYWIGFNGSSVPAGAPAAPVICIDTNGTNVRTNTAPGNGAVVKLMLYNANAGAQTDPVSGERVALHFELADASEP